MKLNGIKVNFLESGRDGRSSEINVHTHALLKTLSRSNIWQMNQKMVVRVYFLGGVIGSIMAPGFCSWAIRTCSRRLYLFLNFFWQYSHWRGDCSVCCVRMCLHKLTVVITSLQNWHWLHLLGWPSIELSGTAIYISSMQHFDEKAKQTRKWNEKRKTDNHKSKSNPNKIQLKNQKSTPKVRHHGNGGFEHLFSKCTYQMQVLDQIVSLRVSVFLRMKRDVLQINKTDR